MFPVWHVGTDYLHEIGKNWYDYLVSKGVKFEWEAKVTAIDFENNRGAVSVVQSDLGYFFEYDRLVFAVGKSGIDFGKNLADQYTLPTEPKPVQIGVRFEAPQKHFQKLLILVMILNYIVNSKTKEYHYAHSVQTTTQLMLPLSKRMEMLVTTDTPKKEKNIETI